MDDLTSEQRTCEVCGTPLNRQNKLGVCSDRSKPECMKVRGERERKSQKRAAPPKPEPQRCRICGKALRTGNQTGLCDGKGSPECRTARNALHPRPERPPTPEAPRCDICGCKLTRNNVYGVCNGHGKPVCRRERYLRERDGLVGEKRLLVTAGDAFGRWTALEDSHFMGDRTRCRCECGIERQVQTKGLIDGVSRSCGCAPRRARKYSGPYIAAGTVVGRLTVLQEVRRSTDTGKARCLCECGTEVFVAPLSLKHGTTRSCGCLRRDLLSKRGGASKHPLYKIWHGMVQRCTNPKTDSYPNYGGRGITVCERWMDLHLFIEDIEREIGPRPEGTYPSGVPLYTLDRKDNDSGYRPGNVRWSTQSEQILNQRTIAQVSRERDALIAELAAMKKMLVRPTRPSAPAGNQEALF